MPIMARSLEFGAPAPQSNATDGWEDGISISRDGLHLFAMYMPADFLSFILAGANMANAHRYLRGPRLGMDLTTNVNGFDVWLHANIVYASRSSRDDPFGSWNLSSMARPEWSDAAPCAQYPLMGRWDVFAHTTNQHPPDYKAHICIARNQSFNLDTLGTLLPAPVTTNTTEDNPHIERIDEDSLVLFFDSNDRPGGTGMHDLWFTTSNDDGASWATPQPVDSINTALEDEQPHLWRDTNGDWWIYYTGTNTEDGKLGIFRAKQTVPNSWNNWGTKELVIGAGNTAGVGEPTLTEDGDISFVVIYQDPDGSNTNQFDADPWYAPRIPSGLANLSHSQHVHASTVD